MISFFKQSECCGYGTDGKKTNYDCLMIPGAQKDAVGAKGSIQNVPPTQCGGGGGLVTATGMTSTTVCCK